MIGRRLMLAGLVAAAALPSPALETRAAPRADVAIRELVSFHSRGFVYRAMKGTWEIYPFLVIEKLRLGETEGDATVLVASWRAEDMKGGNLLESVEGDDFEDLRWNQGVLRFTFRRVGRILACSVSGVEAGSPAVSCEPGTR